MDVDFMLTLEYAINQESYCLLGQFQEKFLSVSRKTQKFPLLCLGKGIFSFFLLFSADLKGLSPNALQSLLIVLIGHKKNNAEILFLKVPKANIFIIVVKDYIHHNFQKTLLIKGRLLQCTYLSRISTVLCIAYVMSS